MVDGINTSITTCKTRELNLRDSSVFWLPFKSTHLPKKGLKKKQTKFQKKLALYEGQSKNTMTIR